MIVAPDTTDLQAVVESLIAAVNGQLDRDNLAAQAGILPQQLLGFEKPVSALPQNPFDGQLCLFQTAAMEAAGVPPWLLRYRAKNGDGTANASAYKWEPLGAPAPLFAEVTPGETTASLTYVALATAGPSVTLPLAGDYMVEHGVASASTTIGGNINAMSYDIGATGAVDADWALNNQASNTPAYRKRRKNGLTANTTLTAKYRTSGGTSSFAGRFICVTPARVG